MNVFHKPLEKNEKTRKINEQIAFVAMNRYYGHVLTIGANAQAHLS